MLIDVLMGNRNVKEGRRSGSSCEITVGSPLAPSESGFSSSLSIFFSRSTSSVRRPTLRETSRSKLSSVQLSPRLATEGRAVMKVCFWRGVRPRFGRYPLFPLYGPKTRAERHVERRNVHSDSVRAAFCLTAEHCQN